LEKVPSVQGVICLLKVQQKKEGRLTMNQVGVVKVGDEVDVGVDPMAPQEAMLLREEDLLERLLEGIGYCFGHQSVVCVGD
jgi:hypothetical protein